MNISNSLGPQRRYVAIADAEVREEGGGLRFSGHAAVFDRKTYIGPKPHGFWEKVRIGAFAKAVTDGDVRMLHNHNPDLILARSTIKEGPGSLVLSEEKRGLMTKAEWAPTSYASDLAVNLRLGTVSQMSFSFIPTPTGEIWTRDEKTGADMRELTEVELYDVSTVTFPAYADTDAAMRSIGLDGLLRVAELNEAQRADFYMTLRTGLITPEVAPAMRAASEALADLAQRGEQAEATTHEEGQSSDYRRLRYRAMAAMAASWRTS